MASAITIAKIKSIKRLAVFDNYQPASDLPEFKKQNLIYGFNGSGKTCLSRIFGSLETGIVNEHFPEDCSFELELSDKTKITQDNDLQRIKDRVLVFNTDFIWRNLSWKETTANPIFYIGEGQTKAAARLTRAEKCLPIREQMWVEYRATRDSIGREFSLLKRSMGAQISNATNLGGSYNAGHLNRGYEAGDYKKHTVIPDADLEGLTAFVRKKAPKPEISNITLDVSSLFDLFDQIVQTCGISTSEIVIEELRKYPTMQSWAKTGLDFHSMHDLEDCLFCGNKISQTRIDDLGVALDDKFQRLTDDVKNLVNQLDERILHLLFFNAELPAVDSVVEHLAPEYKKLAGQLVEQVSEVRNLLLTLQEVLGRKQMNLGEKIKVEEKLEQSDFANILGACDKSVKALNSVLEAHNENQKNFEREIVSARERIIAHHLIQGEKEYFEQLTALANADAELERRENRHARGLDLVRKIQEQISSHGPAVKKINLLLSGYLGHRELELVALEEGYNIFRHNKPLEGPLSEGEKTALALCYFLSKFEEENNKLSDLIIVIDDPISSLDTSALNYAFNLIRAATKDAAQLFLFTHNIHFMNEIKKWLKPRANPKDSNKEAKATLLMLECYSDGVSDKRSAKLVKLHKLLANFDSEYHYLFNLMLQLVAAQTGESVPYLYVMPNVLRRVLETFLAFKVPTSAGLTNKLDCKIVQEQNFDPAKLMALNRLTQLESHGDSIDDLIGFSSMTIEETTQAASSLLELMTQMDPQHIAEMRKCCPSG